MNKRRTKPTKLSEEEMDERVIAEAAEDAAWQKPTRVKRKTAPVQLPGDLAARVAFLAKLHREKSAEAWLKRIIQERVEFEETVFGQVRRELGASRRGT